MKEEIEREQKVWINVEENSLTGRVEKHTAAEKIAELGKGILVLEEMRNVITRAQETIDSSVGFKSNGEDFIFQEEEADAAIHELKELFANDNISGAMKFSSNYEDFCGSMKVQKNGDKLAVTNHKKKQNDNDAFDYNSKQMEDMLVEIKTLNNKIGEKFNEVYLKYETIFGNLRGTELMDDILREFDLNLELSSFMDSEDNSLRIKVDSLYPSLDKFSNLEEEEVDNLSSTEIQKYLGEIINKMKELFPEMNSRELFDLFLYLVAMVSYGGAAWNVTWGNYSKDHREQLIELRNQEWYHNFEIIITKNHDNKEAFIDWVHFAANLLALETKALLGLGVGDFVSDPMSGWLGDHITTLTLSDVNSDRLALLVEKDIQNGVNPIESIQKNYEIIKENPMTVEEAEKECNRLIIEIFIPPVI